MYKVYSSIIALAFLSVTGLHAQSPGGVSANLSLWLKADNSATLSPTTGSLNTWTYSNNGSNQFAAVVGNQPTVQANTFNFLPSIAFNGNQYMSGPAGASAPIAAGSLAYSVFAVWQSSTAVGGVNERIWAQRPNSSAGDNSFDGASFWVFPSGPTYGDQPEISPYLTGVAYAPSYNTYMLSYAPNTPYISEMNLLNQNTNDLEVMDQTNYTTGPFVTSTDPAGNATVDRILSNGANLLGARSTSIDEPFNGNLAELIVYSASTGATARSQIFSYLSMKYGIPLAGTYISSAGATLWDYPTNASYGFNSSNYNNFIFGIARDDNSGLLVTQSNSSVTGTGTGAGQSGMGNIVLSNPATFPDQSFIIVGSNNAGLTETTANLPAAATAGSERLATQWLVTTSGTPGTVNVSFDFTGLTVSGTIGNVNDFRLMIDNDADGDFTTGTPSLIAPSSFTGNVANFTNVNLASNNHLVMAIMSNAGAGTPLPVNFISFDAQPNDGNVDLNWTVGDNQQASNYVVERSSDGINYSRVGQVANIATQTDYSFADQNAGSGTLYYRVLETDQDGKSIYSKVLTVSLGAGEFSIQVLNNPSAGSTEAQLQINAVSAGKAFVELWSAGGSRISLKEQAIGTGPNTVSVPMASLPAGSYVVKVMVNNVTKVVQVVKL